MNNSDDAPVLSAYYACHLAREEEAIETEPTAERAPRRTPAPAYWLIAKNENGRMEVLTFDCGGEEMLPVFSFEEEAEMFLQLEDVGDGWLVRKSRAGELVSVLHGPCSGVKEVALDPLPRMVAERTVGLVSLLRECFIERITARKNRLGSGVRIEARASTATGARRIAPTR